MPSISMFFGLVIYMYNFDNIKHKLPHIHIKYQGEFCTLSLPECEIIEGKLPSNKLNLVKAWVIIHEEELMANWDLAINGETIFKIDPLK